MAKYIKVNGKTYKEVDTEKSIPAEKLAAIMRDLEMIVTRLKRDKKKTADSSAGLTMEWAHFSVERAIADLNKFAR